MADSTAQGMGAQGMGAQRLRMHTPLDDRPAWQGRTAAIAERPHVGKVTLRGVPDLPAFREAAEARLGVALPLAPNTVTEGGGLTVSWVGPDEWLILTEPGAEGALIDGLREALAGVHAAVVDVGDYYTIIRLSGPRARDVMAKGCPLDLHPRAFGPGRCAGSLYGKAVIRLIQVDEAPTYDIMVRWSFADYLWRYLVDAAEEWG